MDLASIIGIIVGIGSLILGFTIEGGRLAALLSISPIFIVFGGTVGAVMVSHPMKNVIKLPKLFIEAFTSRKTDIKDSIDTIIKLSIIARKEGLLSLENVLDESPEYRNIDPIMKKGLMLAIDGTSRELIQEIMRSRIYVEEMDRKTEIKMFDDAGGFSPTMGIIGTVMGLVNVLGNLSDPEHLSGAIAVSFIATLYGVGFANLVYLPIANKLKLRAKEEKLEKEIILEGILSISAGENPMIIREKLNALFENKDKRDMKSKGRAEEL